MLHTASIYMYTIKFYEHGFNNTYLLTLHNVMSIMPYKSTYAYSIDIYSFFIC